MEGGKQIMAGPRKIKRGIGLFSDLCENAITLSEDHVMEQVAGDMQVVRTMKRLPYK